MAIESIDWGKLLRTELKLLYKHHMTNMSQAGTYGYRTHFLKLEYTYSTKQEHLYRLFFQIKNPNHDQVISI